MHDKSFGALKGGVFMVIQIAQYCIVSIESAHSNLSDGHKIFPAASGENVTTDGAISLFTSAFNNALDRQKQL